MERIGQLCHYWELCTFVDNSYHHSPLLSMNFPGWTKIPSIATIMAYPLDPYFEPSVRSPNETDAMIVALSVSNCVFHNNVFLYPRVIRSLLRWSTSYLHSLLYICDCDSCFVDNEGYSSGVMSISEGDTLLLSFKSPEPSTHFFSGNQFIGNMPKEDHKSCCILSRQYIHFGSDGIPRTIRVARRMWRLWGYEFFSSDNSCFWMIINSVVSWSY